MNINTYKNITNNNITYYYCNNINITYNFTTITTNNIYNI